MPEPAGRAELRAIYGSDPCLASVSLVGIELLTIDARIVIANAEREEPDAAVARSAGMTGHARVEACSGLRYSRSEEPRSSPPSTASVTPVM
jgi:hypothetical protein